MKHRSDAPIVLHGQVVEEVKVFTYLRSKMTTDRDTKSEINVRLSKAGEAGQCYGLGRNRKTRSSGGLW